MFYNEKIKVDECFDNVFTSMKYITVFRKHGEWVTMQGRVTVNSSWFDPSQLRQTNHCLQL